MKRADYRGSYLIGFIIVGVVAFRAMIWFQGGPVLFIMVLLLTGYVLLYATQPWLMSHIKNYKYFYFPAQTALALVLTNLRPFTDIFCLVYVPLCLQAIHAFPRRAATAWTIFYAVILAVTLLLGKGWMDGLALIFLFYAVFAFWVSYDDLYSQAHIDQAESQRLLGDLQSAHRQLQAYAAQAQELAAARERNQLAHELHDSVSQMIFGITLFTQSARLLLEREPTRALKEIEHLQNMTSSALAQLRSLIAELHPR